MWKASISSPGSLYINWLLIRPMESLGRALVLAAHKRDWYLMLDEQVCQSFSKLCSYREQLLFPVSWTHRSDIVTLADPTGTTLLWVYFLKPGYTRGWFSRAHKDQMRVFGGQWGLILSMLSFVPLPIITGSLDCRLIPQTTVTGRRKASLSWESWEKIQTNGGLLWH